MSNQKPKIGLRWILCLALLVGLGGCASFDGVTMGELNLALTDIQSAVDRALPTGKRQVSANGREFYSNYFVPRKRRLKAAKKNAKVRFYAHVFVLGDQRPYNIRVVVKRQHRTNSNVGLKRGYSDVGSDQRLAKVVLKRIQRRLAKRRDDRNIIDDFRVF